MSNSLTGDLRHIDGCNLHDLSQFVAFHIAGKAYGWVRRDTAAVLQRQHPDVFLVTDDAIILADHFGDFSSRSAALAQATQTLCRHFHKELRHEFYPVLENWGDQPLAQIDRVAVPWFGVRAFGVHVNGYTWRDGALMLWIGERDASRGVDPGKLDNMIGGGQPIGLSIRDNLRKEAMEEAGLSPDQIDHARHSRTLRYRLERHDGLRNDTLFIFDLELPANIAPKNTDGEVAAFHLLPATEVAAIIHETDRFKFNCSMVLIDFLMRQGVITADHTDYAGLCAALPSQHNAEQYR